MDRRSSRAARGRLARLTNFRDDARSPLAEEAEQAICKPSHAKCLPQGLLDVMNELSREIIRAQPADIISFAAQYFEDEVERKTGRRPMTWAKHSPPADGPSDNDKQAADSPISLANDKHTANEPSSTPLGADESQSGEDLAAARIQALYRGHRQRASLAETMPGASEHLSALRRFSAPESDEQSEEREG